MSNLSKLKLAYFSPLNPVQSGISDYSEELLPALSHYADLDLFLANFKPSNPKILQNFACYPDSKFESLARNYDAWLFHMGNSAAHTTTYELLHKNKNNPKNILVLHDFVLHHFLIGHFLNRGKVQEYIRMMRTNYGQVGEEIAREVIKGKLPHVLFDFPLSDEAIEAAHAVIVHSHYAADLIRSRHPNKKVGIVRMGVPLLPSVDKQTARARLGLPLNEFVLVSLGHLNPYKRLDSALWAFKSFNREFPASRYILVGSLSPNYDVKAMIRALGLENKVQVIGFASDTTYNDYLYASDVCINLRYPTAGETSASLLRIMGAGRPVLVSRTGTFDELPDDTCIKVDVDEAEEELLLEYLRLLKRDQALVAQIGANARNHVATSARLEDAAFDYYEFICCVLNVPTQIPKKLQEPVLSESVEENEIQNGKTSLITTIINDDSMVPENQIIEAEDSLVGEVAQAAVELGLEEDASSISDIAKAIEFSSSY